MISDIKILNILGDYRGQLVALEENKDIPFEIKRVFYIFGTQSGISRGNHAHYKANQFLIAVNGSCQITLDNGLSNKKTFLLDKPNLGLFQPALMWGAMYDFSDDCVLLVLSDMTYDECDYIREYESFLVEVQK